MKKSVIALLSLVLISISLISLISADYSCCSSEIQLDYFHTSHWEKCAAATWDACNPLHLNFGSCRDHHQGSKDRCWVCCDKTCQSGYSNCDGSLSNGCETRGSCCSAGSWTWANNYRCSGWRRQRLQTRWTNPSGCTSTSRWVYYDCPGGYVCTGSGSCCKVATCAEMGLECGSWYDSNCNYPINCDAQRGCNAGEECHDGLCNLLVDAQWTDMNGQIITDADEGDTVLMKVEGRNLLGKNISYTVEVSEDPGIWNLWNLFGLIEWSAIMDTDNIGYLELVTTEDDGGNSYKFTAEVLGEIFGEKTSPDLDLYDDDDDDYDDDNDGNTPPIAEIIAPEDEHETSVDYELDFEQLSEDEDDLLKITWNFGDGDTYVYENYAKGLDSSAADTTHSYDSYGVYDVVLTAEEMERDKEATDRINIRVFKEGINVVPRITKPVGGISYNESIVEFDASESYVSNCSFDQCEAPEGKECFDIEGGLHCYYIHEPNTIPGSVLDGYYLTFDWTFTTGTKVETKSGIWSEYDDVVKFTEFFKTSGAHKAELIMTYIEI